MNGNIIKLVLRNFSEGSGFANVHADMGKLQAGMADLGKASQVLSGMFGDLGRIAGAGFKALLTGGMWEIAAQGIRLLIKLTGEWGAAMDAADAAETKAFRSRQSALSKYHASLLKASSDATAAMSAEAKAIDAQAASLERAARAAVELNRQKAIASGENAGTVNAAADWENAWLDRESRRKAAASGVRQAENGVASARRGLSDANKIYQDLLREREKAVQAVSDRIQHIWAQENSFAAKNGFRLKKELEKSFMSGRTDENYNERVATLADIESRLAAAKEGVSASERALAEAEKNRANALRDEQSVAAQIEAEQLKGVNEAAEMERKAAKEREEQADEQERLRMEEEIAAGRAAQKLQEEEWAEEEKHREEIRRQEEQDRQDALQKGKAANADLANDLRDKLKKAQDDVATAAAQFANPKLLDLKAERKAARLADINRVRLANAAIDLQARNPNWRFARNLNRRDEAARRWLIAKENEKKVKDEQKQVVDKLANIEKLLQTATTL